MKALGTFQNKTTIQELRFRKQEVKYTASKIIGIINTIESDRELFKNVEQGHFEKAFEAIKEILKSKINKKAIQNKTFNTFIKALNEAYYPHQRDYGLIGGPDYRNPPVLFYTQRGIADALNKYLQCFVDTPMLEKQNPLGVCTVCNKLFIKEKISKKWCSSKCRSSAFNKTKDKEYFRSNTERSRKGKKRNICNSANAKKEKNKQGTHSGITRNS